MSITRREFVITLLQTSACAPMLQGCVAGVLQAFNSENAEKNAYSFGTLGDGSTVTKVNLGNESSSTLKLPVQDGHSLLRLPNKRMLCLPQNNSIACVVGENLKGPRLLQAPSGYAFSGHSALQISENLVWISLKRAKTKTAKDYGAIWILDASSLTEKTMINSRGLSPHEIVFLKHSPLAAICHYGMTETNTYTYAVDTILEPKISFFNVQTYKIESEVLTAPEYGAMTHLVANDVDDLFAIPLKFSTLDEKGYNELRKFIGADFVISDAEKLEKRIGFPGPIFHISKFSVKDIVLVDRVRQRRAQSIAYSSQTNKVYVTYPFAGTWAVLGQDSKPRILSAKDYGFPFFSGVAVVPQSGDIVLSNPFEGIAVLSSETLKLRMSAKVDLQGAIHLSI